MYSKNEFNPHFISLTGYLAVLENNGFTVRVVDRINYDLVTMISTDEGDEGC